jgi:hypothetical protein
LLDNAEGNVPEGTVACSLQLNLLKSHFRQVHRVSFDHESNLVKIPFFVHFKVKEQAASVRIDSELSTTREFRDNKRVFEEVSGLIRML